MTQVFEKLLQVSLQTSVLAILILLARKILIKRSNFFMNILFILFIARLVIPISIQSPLSIQNLFNTSRVAIVGHALVDNFSQMDNSNIPAPSYSVDNTSKVNDADVSSTQDTNPSTTSNKPHLSIMDIATVVWIFGVLLSSALISINNMIFRSNVKKNRACNDEILTKLLLDCKESLGINRNISAIYCNRVNTAAIHGVIKPILLISNESFNRLNMDEKRQIIIHELLHIKRHDTLTTMITVILNIIHWFNPILWIAFHTLRKDLEIMCDSEVLKNIGHQNKHSYATTLVKLVSLNPSKSSSLMTSLSVDTDIKRRITMISKQHKNTILFRIISIVITIAIILAGCTTKVTQKEEDISLGIIGGADGPTAVYTAKTVDNMEHISTFMLQYDKIDSTLEWNLKWASTILNDITLQSKEILSMNALLGERNKANGWKDDGEGLCRFTSALYISALQAEFEIIDVSHHSLSANYVSGGLDAMLNYGTDDLVITNTYDNDIKFMTSADNGVLKIDIYGTPRDHTVEITSELVESGQVPEHQYKYSCDTTPSGESIPEGESVVITESQPKQTFNIIKTRYDLDGKEIEKSVINTVTYNDHKGTIYVNAPTP